MWIRDVEGHLVNLDHVEMVYGQERGTWHVYALFRAGVEATLFRGTAEECGKYRDQLLDRLNRRNEPELY